MIGLKICFLKQKLIVCFVKKAEFWMFSLLNRVSDMHIPYLLPNTSLIQKVVLRILERSHFRCY